jgi:hypothetical protein
MPWRSPPQAPPPRPRAPTAARLAVAAWRDPTVRHYRSVNLLLKSSIILFRAGLIPRAAMGRVLIWAEALAARGKSMQRRFPR